jgi:signal transduction histidine kinase
MAKKESTQLKLTDKKAELAEKFRLLSYKILTYANRDLPRIDFLRKISKILIRFSGCQAIGLKLKESGKRCSYENISCTKTTFDYMIKTRVTNKNRGVTNYYKKRKEINDFCHDLLDGYHDSSLPFFTTKGSFWMENKADPNTYKVKSNSSQFPFNLGMAKNIKSIALVPLVVGNDRIGILHLISENRFHFNIDQIDQYENFAQTLGLALINQRSHAALRERVKELTCLYGIARIAEKPSVSLKEILQKTVNLLPRAWQYPKITQGRITFDNLEYSTSNFQKSIHSQSADIVVGGLVRGRVEVNYSKNKPQIDEGPFLKEERHLIDIIARELSLIIERRQHEEEKLKLQEQLRHADRLATIGQLTAGVAHELNEPLGNILGFAQLAKKFPGLADQVKKDLENIVTTSLYSREIIKKLMLFTRQTPSRKELVNLNQIVEDGLYFLESRCNKEGIEVVKSFSKTLPLIYADPSQLNQVLVNLVVNAIHAMPEGGILYIKTQVSKNNVILTIEDSGIGMNEELIKQIFLPFYTTKDVGEGTGLGLSVVHGIITSHNGSIKVESKVGKGTKFEIKFPIKKVA